MLTVGIGLSLVASSLLSRHICKRWRMVDVVLLGVGVWVVCMGLLAMAWG